MSITYREGTPADSFAVSQVLEVAIRDLTLRQGTAGAQPESEPDETWARMQPLHVYISETASFFWIAEEGDRVVGYARTIDRDGVRELTDFFVLPGVQSNGVGRELLRRAFPAEGAKHRIIIATTDVRAQSRYIKAGVLPRFPSLYWINKPQPVDISTDLHAERIDDSTATLEALAQIDLEILGHRRDVDHQWLGRIRTGWLYRRAGQAVGYAYHGAWSGPYAWLDARDAPAIMARSEQAAIERDATQIGFEIPGINRAALDYVLGRHYRLDPFLTFFMSDAPFGKFENYIFTSPPMFI